VKAYVAQQIGEAEEFAKPKSQEVEKKVHVEQPVHEQQKPADVGN